jgi:hypothetical protein
MPPSLLPPGSNEDLEAIGACMVEADGTLVGPPLPRGNRV